MKSEYLEAGKIVAVHALHGEVKVNPWCDSPEILCNFKYVFLGRDKKKTRIESARPVKTQAVVKLEGVDTPEAAQTLRNTVLYIKREQLPLGENEHFIADLIGLAVFDADTGELYGEIIDVLQTGANDVYVIRGSKGELLVPVLPHVVLEIDTENEKVLIRPLEGLFE